MTIKIGINGFGRIGSSILRAMTERNVDLEVVRINDLTEDTRILAGLLRNDTVKGRFPGDVSYEKEALVINGRRIPVTKERDPVQLKWRDYGDRVVVVESTGVFLTRDKCMQHVAAGAERVLLTVPPKDEVDYVVVMGCNDEGLSSEHQVISNASCTTNSIGTPARVLDEAFGIEAGLMTTVHSATNDQRVCDAIHLDLRRARSVFGNLIPTSTGAAIAAGLVVKSVAGRLNGGAIRTPTVCGSVSVLDLYLRTDVTKDDVNAVLKKGQERFPGIMAMLDDDLDEPVLADIVNRSESALIDAKRTLVVQKRFAQVYSWYDNEWGYVNRCVDLLQLFAGC